MTPLETIVVEESDLYDEFELAEELVNIHIQYIKDQCHQPTLSSSTDPLKLGYVRNTENPNINEYPSVAEVEEAEKLLAEYGHCPKIISTKLYGSFPIHYPYQNVYNTTLGDQSCSNAKDARCMLAGIGCSSNEPIIEIDACNTTQSILNELCIASHSPISNSSIYDDFPSTDMNADGHVEDSEMKTGGVLKFYQVQGVFKSYSL